MANKSMGTSVEKVVSRFEEELCSGAFDHNLTNDEVAKRKQKSEERLTEIKFKLASGELKADMTTRCVDRYDVGVLCREDYNN